MLTFSSICDRFVEANGLEKDLCANDEEAKHKASQLKNSELATDSKRIYGEPVEPTLNSQLVKYPVRYFASDTTGEKAYEEFYVPGEKIDMQRFQALGVVEQTARHDMAEVDAFFQNLEAIFAKDDFTKAQVVDALCEFLPNFQHEETGKNLDQKM